MSRRLKCTTLHQNKSWQHAPFKMSHGTGTGGGPAQEVSKNSMQMRDYRFTVATRAWS